MRFTTSRPTRTESRRGRTRISPELVITRGLPASGKTTFARNWVESGPARVRVNRDDLRFNLFGRYYGLTREQEDRVTDVQTAAVRALLERGISVVVDDTHLRLAHAKRWASLARDLGATFGVVDIPTPAEICVERDEARRAAGERAVGAEVIQGMANRYGLRKGRWLPPVDIDDDAPETWTYVPDDRLPTAWIVDLDGTLALMGDRSPFDWHRVGEDSLNEPVRDLVFAISQFYDHDFGERAKIVVLSGRDEVCRPETEGWLIRHELDYDALYMRPKADGRKDAVVKLELFREQVAPRYHIRGVIDDRRQVVEMWRSIGLFCAQVAPGDF